MAEISIQELNKYYGENHVLKNIGFEIYKGEKVGLLGKNGSGKTTLFKIISGSEIYESGSACIGSGMKVALLEQLPQYPDHFTVLDVLKSSFGNLAGLEEEMRALEELMLSDTSPSLLRRYGDLQARFEALGGYEQESRLTRVYIGLKITQGMLSQHFNQLSGGEKTRVNLARIMLLDADLLLLDEPTNHLDIESVEWLEEYLAGYGGTVMVISHDRYFLDRVVTRIIELENGEAEFYEGSYSYYVREKEERRLQKEASYKNYQNEVKRLQESADRLHEWARNADNPALHARAFAIEKRIEKMEKVEKPSRDMKLESSFQESRFSGREILVVKDAFKSYGSNPVLKGISLSAFKGERIALLGPNGCGKTTLIRLLTGEEPPDSGTAALGRSIRCCYLPQVISFENPQFTMLDTVRHALETSGEKARQKLAAYHFKGKDLMKKVASLSGGEKSRLRLCISMQEQINLLILDEPTNHLDISSREWIEEAVADYKGTLLFVSHDRYFINRFATRVWELENGVIHDFNRSYEEYRSWKAARLNTETKPVEQRDGKCREKPGKPGNPGVKAENRSKQAKEPNPKDIEDEIDKLEERLKEIDREMDTEPSNYILLECLQTEKANLAVKLERLYDKWLK